MLRAMRIESFAPRYDAIETHSIDIDAPPDVVYRALRTTDFTAAPIIRALMFLRSWHCAPKRRATTLATLTSAGFGLLAEEENHELVLGVVGRFWRPTGNILPFDVAQFSAPVPGTAVAVWNFAVTPRGDGTTLSTETRVVCADAKSRRKFLAYWFFVGPFSALIRRVMLRAVKSAVTLQRSRAANV
jgi:hypothetical protein